ncbi:hypothetical protein L2E82_24920 [Cichorium intybus]|uniref:Uncharacterized protein n=1 Tax=Cichorium intybus TaxID=13427 RepID=A0ACB9E218_CICIN|nr:hypothetical protein L2E82_24920 [Cichorium intybus]
MFRTGSSSTSAKCKTPYEILYGHKPSVAHFRSFGCPCTLLHLEATPKFNSKVDDCYFVGYTGPSGVNRDEDEEIIADPIIPPLIFEDPILNDGTSPVSTTLTEDAPADSSQIVGEPPIAEASVTPEGVINSEPADLFNSTLMDSLFPERIPDEYVASTSHDFRDSDRGTSGSGRIENITNLPVSSASLEHAISSRVQRDHLIENVIGSLDNGVQTRSQSGYVNECLYPCFISQIEPRNVDMTLNEPTWVDAMHEELNQFEKLNVWQLVELPEGKKSLDTRWVFRNNQDDSGVIVRNKARLVVRSFRQIEGLDYTEVYALVALLEAIRILLAYASYMNFTVYQMDVKTAFLYGEVKEDIYLDQPLGFVNSKFPNHVYKLDKALYGLHQAPRAWYATLTDHLLQHGYTRGTIEQTLFIKRQNSEQIVVQIYVDDIIFGSTSEALCKEFEQVMKKRFEMSSLGEMTMCLVVCSFRQIEGLDYTEVYALVALLEAIRIFLAYASYINFTVYQMDVKTAFLYGEVKEEIYLDQPLGFVNSKFPNHVYKLDKALYGLHQAPRAWYETLTDHLLQHGYTRGTIEQTLFIKRQNSEQIVVQIYVDDIIFGSMSEALCKEFEQVMKKRFEMSSLGEMTMFLGLQVKQSSTGILLHQGKYVEDILEKFDFKDAKVANTHMAERPLLTSDPDGQSVDQTYYRSMIGSLMYLTASRSDIVFAVCQCARHQTNPKLSHLTYIKRIFIYLKGRPKLGDRLISWQCKKQQTVSTSTAEAEYVAASACCSQVIWMQHQLLDYGLNFVDTPIFCDNDAAIQIVKNSVQHSKTKHIDIKLHFIRDCYERKMIYLEPIHTDNNVSDLFTKPFAKARFNMLVELLKMIRFDDC